MTKTAPFPSKREILDYVRESPASVGKREIARAFGLKGAQRQQLRELLRQLEEEGHLERGGRRRSVARDRLPEVTVVEIVGLDEDGELTARPARWDAETPPPQIFMAPEARHRPALAVGEQVLVRLRASSAGVYEGRTIRRLGTTQKRVLGIYERDRAGGHLRPTSRRAKHEIRVAEADARGAKPGELVLAEIKLRHPRLGEREATVVERLGSLEDHRALSLIAIHEHGLPTAFSEAAELEAREAGPVDSAGRVELRELPLVTIDGPDARDFDDAVFAEPDPNGNNPGGWHLIIAIADVAHYVRPDSALDRAACERGNSAYFPDRVIPMLPEALSNGWCSLRPAEDRGCLAAHLWIDAQGQPLRHRFERAVMRSLARLTYEQVQAAHEGQPDAATAPLVRSVIAPLYGAFQSLAAARRQRGTLELDLPERRVKLDAEGRVIAIEAAARLDSHRLIEEFMIAANVAAAMELERRQLPCMYRVHDQPDKAKVEALRQVLESLGLRLARGQVIRPAVFSRILSQARGTPHIEMVAELILRAQAQAAYSPRNIGHFGLALPRYAHFTSPIRRYADLLVHRGLIAALGLGDDGLRTEDAPGFERTALHISTTERRAIAAERDAVDRLTAAFLQDCVGQSFSGRITGVTRFGLFVSLDASGADGLVPVSSLPDDHYQHDERRHCLVGRRWGRSYRLGDRVQADLVEANPMTGGLVLNLSEPRKTRSDDSSVGWHPLGR